MLPACDKILHHFGEEFRRDSRIPCRSPVFLQVFRGRGDENGGDFGHSSLKKCTPRRTSGIELKPSATYSYTPLKYVCVQLRSRGSRLSPLANPLRQCPLTLCGR